MYPCARDSTRIQAESKQQANSKAMHALTKDDQFLSDSDGTTTAEHTTDIRYDIKRSQ